MSLIYPSFDELSQQIIAEFRVQLPEVDPTIFGSWALAFANGNAVLAQSIMFLVRDLERQLFPQKATGEFLDLWGDYENLPRLPALPAGGNATAAGTLGVVIPALTEFTGNNGIIYKSNSVSTVLSYGQPLDIVLSGSTAIAVSADAHNLVTGQSVTMSGATETEYNVTADIIVLGKVLFSYPITGTPSTPATGAPRYDTDMAIIPITAQTAGVESNLSSGSTLAIVTPITNLDDPITVPYEGITGGASEETDEVYRARILLSRSLIEGVFTPDQIKLAVFSINGNTRCWIKKPILNLLSANTITLTGTGAIATATSTVDHNLQSGLSVIIAGATDTNYNGTVVITVTDTDTFTYASTGTGADSGTWTGIASYLSPSAGQVSVFFVRDNDAPITPSPGDVHTATILIKLNGAMPANMVDDDLFVQGPTLETIEFTFDGLSPDTPTMRTAVEDTLAAFFEDSIEFEEDITEASYLGAIQNTQDLQTGDVISTFSLSTVNGVAPADVAITAGGIGTLGIVTWSI